MTDTRRSPKNKLIRVSVTKHHIKETETYRSDDDRGERQSSKDKTIYKLKLSEIDISDEFDKYVTNRVSEIRNLLDNLSFFKHHIAEYREMQICSDWNPFCEIGHLQEIVIGSIEISRDVYLDFGGDDKLYSSTEYVNSRKYEQFYHNKVVSYLILHRGMKGIYINGVESPKVQMHSNFNKYGWEFWVGELVELSDDKKRILMSVYKSDDWDYRYMPSSSTKTDTTTKVIDSPFAKLANIFRTIKQ